VKRRTACAMPADASLWGALLGVEKTVIEGLEYDEDAELVIAHVRPRSRARGRCGVCGRPCPGYDTGQGRRRWRALDLGTIRTVLEADAPWARHDAGHTYAFDQTVAWLATQSSKTTVTALMRVAWRTVGSIIARVWSDVEAATDRLAGLRRIGIDEISYKKGHKYLTVVVDHDARRLVWAAPGRDKATVRAFFDLLGEDRCARITHVSADGADFIDAVVAAACPNAVRVADPFHVVKWATDALDEVRRASWNQARRLAQGQPRRRRGRPRADAAPRSSERVTALKGARFALWKNPEDLTQGQQAKLAWVAATDPRLHRAYLLKEGLRLIFRMAHAEAADGPGPVGRLGASLPHPGLREAAEEHRQASGQNPRRDRAQPLQWTSRVHEHQGPAHHPDGLRVRLARAPDRPGPAQSRRPPPGPPGPGMTHGYVRRAAFPAAFVG